MNPEVQWRRNCGVLLIGDGIDLTSGGIGDCSSGLWSPGGAGRQEQQCLGALPRGCSAARRGPIQRRSLRRACRRRDACGPRSSASWLRRSSTYASAGEAVVRLTRLPVQQIAHKGDGGSTGNYGGGPGHNGGASRKPHRCAQYLYCSHTGFKPPLADRVAKAVDMSTLNSSDVCPGPVGTGGLYLEAEFSLAYLSEITGPPHTSGILGAITLTEWSSSLMRLLWLLLDDPCANLRDITEYTDSGLEQINCLFG